MRTLIPASAAVKRGLSAAWPRVSRNDGGRQRRSAGRGTLLVNRNPVVDGGPRAVPGGQIPPWAAGAKAPHHGVELPSQIRDRTPLAQQQVGFGQDPFIGGEVTTRHTLCSTRARPCRAVQANPRPRDLNSEQVLSSLGRLGGSSPGPGWSTIEVFHHRWTELGAIAPSAAPDFMFLHEALPG